MFDHGIDRRRAFWFKFKRNGDFITAPSFDVGQLYQATRADGARSVPPDERQLLAGDGTFPLERTHATFHPSRKENAFKKAGAISLHGVAPSPVDLRVLEGRAILMAHQLTRASVYPRAPINSPGILLGNVYENGAPEISIFVTPILNGVTEDFPIPGGPNVLDLVAIGITDNRRDFLLQLVVGWDQSKLFFDSHCLTSPRTYQE